MALSLAIETAQQREVGAVNGAGASGSGVSGLGGVGMFSSALGSMGLGALAGGSARSRASDYPPAVARRGVYVGTA